MGNSDMVARKTGETGGSSAQLSVCTVAGDLVRTSADRFESWLATPGADTRAFGGRVHTTEPRCVAEVNMDLIANRLYRIICASGEVPGVEPGLYRVILNDLHLPTVVVTLVQGEDIRKRGQGGGLEREIQS